MQYPLRLNKAWTISHSKIDLQKSILTQKCHKLPDKEVFFWLLSNQVLLPKEHRETTKKYDLTIGYNNLGNSNNWNESF